MSSMSPAVLTLLAAPMRVRLQPTDAANESGISCLETETPAFMLIAITMGSIIATTPTPEHIDERRSATLTVARIIPFSVVPVIFTMISASLSATPVWNSA